MQYNGDTGTNYSRTLLTGSGTTAESDRESTVSRIIIDYYAFPNTSPGNRIINIQNYSNATTYKTAIMRANYAGGGTDAIVGLWRSTAAINSVKITHNAAQFAAGSTFTLYGIAAA